MEKIVKFPYGINWYRYRYIDWGHGVYSPWYSYNEDAVNKILEDASICSIEFRSV